MNLSRAVGAPADFSALSIACHEHAATQLSSALISLISCSGRREGPAGAGAGVGAGAGAGPGAGAGAGSGAGVGEGARAGQGAAEAGPVRRTSGPGPTKLQNVCRPSCAPEAQGDFHFHQRPPQQMLDLPQGRGSVAKSSSKCQQSETQASCPVHPHVNVSILHV